jgi:hypothetical protein
METSTSQKSYSEFAKTQNMIRALYEYGHSQEHVLDAIQSRGFSRDESIEINFNAYKELQFEKRKSFRIVFWISGILNIAFLSLGIYFDIQENKWRKA